MPIFNGKCARAKRFNGAIILAMLACLIPVMILLLDRKPKTARTTVAGDYITLITGGQIQDSVVAAKLDSAGIKNVLSESSQWFFVNDFSELRRVPLDQFNDFLLKSDPRNDGYAEKLRMFFVQDGKRYFYIPRRSLHSSNPAVAEQRIIEALEGAPHIDIMLNSYAVQNAGGGFIFIAAAVFTLALSVYAAKPFAGGIRAAVTPLLQTAALLPSCALFAMSGPTGFALAAVLLTLFFIFRAPLKSLFIKLRLANESVFSVSCRGLIKQYIRKEKKMTFMIFVMLAAVCITGRVNIFYVLLAALFFCLSAAASIYLTISPRGAGGRIRFAPIAIRPDSNLRLPLIALPFILASALSIVIPLCTQPRTRILEAGEKKQIPAISVKDYEDHINFQKNFAFMKLANTNEAAAASNADIVTYRDFELGPDGLLRPIDGGPSANNMLGGSAADIPPFPLENLLNFFNAESVLSPAVFDIRGLIAVLIALAGYIPYLVFAALGNGKKEKKRLYLNERIIA
jgi:hypothetical protein